jgi:hypothetical protein
MKTSHAFAAAAAITIFSGFWPANARPDSGQPTDSGVIPVTIVESEGRYTLFRGGEPYLIKGAGIPGWDVSRFAAHGGNSFRNWRDNRSPDGLKILDEAARHGLTVAMCIPVGRERHGFDYDDEEAVARQFEMARNEVLRYKDHPALLVWIIGNEPDLSHTNPKVFDAINDISEMIHELDGNHPTTTALTFSFNPEMISLVKDRMPDLDIISVQKYADVINVPRYIEEAGIDRPYFVTEWGPKGHWEVPKTSWGAPLEATSSEKAAHYLSNYQRAIAAHPDRIIGSYAFLWGQKQERTPTWYGMFLEDGSETETVDVMHYVWNGEWPDNRSPRIDAMTLGSNSSDQDVTLNAGSSYLAEVIAQDPDGDPLSYRWEVMRESGAQQEGGDSEEIPEVLRGLIEGAGGSVNVMAPAEAGAYRLFVYVHDGQGHAGHANIPFLVNETDSTSSGI